MERKNLLCAYSWTYIYIFGQSEQKQQRHIVQPEMPFLSSWISAQLIWSQDLFATLHFFVSGSFHYTITVSGRNVPDSFFQWQLVAHTKSSLKQGGPHHFCIHQNMGMQSQQITHPNLIIWDLSRSGPYCQVQEAVAQQTVVYLELFGQPSFGCRQICRLLPKKVFIQQGLNLRINASAENLLEKQILMHLILSHQTPRKYP